MVYVTTKILTWMLQNGLLVWPWWHYIFHNKWHAPRSINTIAYNYLSTRVAKTFSAGQSKFKVSTVKLQSLPAQFGTFWRDSIQGIKVDQQRVRAFCVWSFENQNEWNSCFSSRYLLNSPVEKHQPLHLAIRRPCELWDFFHDIFFNTTTLTAVFSRAKSASLLLAQVFKSSLLLAFASSRVDLNVCFFSSMNFSLGFSTPACRRKKPSLVFGTRHSPAFNIVGARCGDLFSFRRFQIWFRALLVTAVLTLFDASLLNTLTFKTSLWWPLDFRVDSERKWRSSARYRADNVEVKTFSLIPLHNVIISQ